MAGLATFALLDTGFDEIDRTVLDRLARAGLSGLLLVDDCEEERWRSAGWPVLRRDTDPSRICSVMQDLVRRGAPSGGSSQGTGPASAAVSETVTGPVAADTDWLSAATPASTGSKAAAQETAWLEELWRQSPGSPGDGMVPSQLSWFSGGAGTGDISGQNRRRGPEPTAMSPADDGRRGRIVLVWGPHGSPGRSTVSASLAHGLAASGGAILVDADVEAPSLVQLLGMPEDSSALAGAARLATHGRLDAESFQRVLAPVGGGLSLLGGLGRSGRWRELPPASMTEVWLQCRRAAAWTVVDVAGGPVDDDVDDFTLEPGRGAVTADLVSHADVILVVGGADPVGVRRLLQLLDEVGSSMSPTGRVEVIINRVRASAAGPSPQHALREALARFGGLEDIVLLPDDAATADACLLRGCAVLEGAPTSALGKALSALVDRIDPQAAAARKARSPRRSLLRRSKKRGGHRDPADQVPSTRGRNRSTARSAGARRRRKGGGGGRAVGERLPAPQAPGGPARTSQQPLQDPPPAIQPVNQPVNHPPGRPQGLSPSRSPVIPPAQSSPPAQSPPLAKPIFMTISTSSAPFAIASFVSKALAEEVAAPRGNPITVQTFTSVPANCAFAKATRAGFTHTEQNPYSAASPQSRATCACVA